MVPAGRAVSRDDFARVRQGARTRLRREPAPAGRVLRRAGPQNPPSRSRRAAGREAALLQQPQRPLGSASARARVRRSGVCDRQAREPLRRRCGRHDRGGVRGGSCRRPRLRLRRGRRPEPRGERSAWRSARRAVRRGALRARLRRAGAGDARAQDLLADPRQHRTPGARQPSPTTGAYSAACLSRNATGKSHGAKT